jgi:hypothetical protein
MAPRGPTNEPRPAVTNAPRDESRGPADAESRNIPYKELASSPEDNRRCSESAELEDIEHIINTLPHLLRHPQGIRDKQRFRLEECRKKMRRFETTQL